MIRQRLDSGHEELRTGLARIRERGEARVAFK